ncbi:FkbM family methyltransferase [Glaciihabitans sp. dw_435]|uniref:FkbM family methyltransferase n=1 Tax=Glaciihabitans sp. dw_435 TaxID=2720081 RepID=UPI001BD37E7C|nr:FkbM family methyltransferase [Glaciihabitans sp. dw_435]
MRFTSYAQNFEDVLLHRALGHVERGQYIDVGAADPELGSITKAFYDRGWHGTNVEPVAAAHNRLVETRLRDISLQLALGEDDRPVTLYSVAEFAEMSTVDSRLRSRYAEAGRTIVQAVVAGDTLENVWNSHIDEDVHFLSVNVEGAELAVLRGANFATQRPWVIVLRVVADTTMNETAEASDQLLVDARYTRVFFDGLSRFYVANEKLAELAPAFDRPVNVSDDFRLPTESVAESTLARVASALGMSGDEPPRAVIERAIALTTDHPEVGSSAAVDDLATALEVAERRHSALQVEVEAVRQQSFERERYIAAMVSDVDRARREVVAVRAAAARSAAEAREVARESASAAVERNIAGMRANAEVTAHALRAAEAELAAVYRSTSWKFSMPLRALRQPGLYLRKLFRR